VSLSQPASFTPAITLDNSGRIHLVWAEFKDDGINEKVVYVQGTISGSGVNWSSPLTISDDSLENANSPQILVHNGIINVFFTLRETRQQGGETVYDQYIYWNTCSVNCTESITNWSSVGNPISGARVGANTQDPFFVASTAVAHQGCLFSYFHGTSDDFDENSELIWGVNNCGQSWGFTQRVTDDNHRSLYPSLASQGQWLFLAYESGPAGSNNRQIHFHRARTESVLYLPIIAR
jgi:hypothetical protein